MYNEIINSHIDLHDCRVNSIKYHKGILSFVLCNGIYIQGELSRRKSQIDHHLVFEDFDDIHFYVYKKNIFNQLIREDWSNKFIEKINNDHYLFEIVTTYTTYQGLLYKGYLWFDKKPYSYECDIELFVNDVKYYEEVH